MTVKPIEVIWEVDKRSALAAVSPKSLDTSKIQLAACLDDIRSLWNVGSIFRSADGAGFDTLFLCGITGTPPRKEIAKTSLGAEEHVQWHYFGFTAELLPLLRQQGFMIVGLEFVEEAGEQAGSMSLKQALAERKLAKPLCLVVGNEVLGVSGEALSHCDLVCHLPMRGFKESLNVAVAFGIAAYEIAEQLQ
jgi:tRNA G18 (ribose-2'-O)-methylase SpoU